MKLNLNDVIINPHLTEKATILKDDENKYIFKVHPHANKVMIKQACKDLFDVDAEKVCIINMRGKKRRMRRQFGKKPDWKKAIITLKRDQSFSFLDGV